MEQRDTLLRNVGSADFASVVLLVGEARARRFHGRMVRTVPRDRSDHRVT